MDEEWESEGESGAWWAGTGILDMGPLKKQRGERIWFNLDHLKHNYSLFQALPDSSDTSISLVRCSSRFQFTSRKSR